MQSFYTFWWFIVGIYYRQVFRVVLSSAAIWLRVRVPTSLPRFCQQQLSVRVTFLFDWDTHVTVYRVVVILEFFFKSHTSVYLVYLDLALVLAGPTVAPPTMPPSAPCTQINRTTTTTITSTAYVNNLNMYADIEVGMG